jgi:hypothetical protein
VSSLDNILGGLVLGPEEVRLFLRNILNIHCKANRMKNIEIESKLLFLCTFPLYVFIIQDFNEISIPIRIKIFF